jgi:hypothetical protein
MRMRVVVVCLMVLGLFLGQQPVHATEVGGSYYFPGISIAFAPGIPPHPGYTAIDQMLFLSGTHDKTLQGGRVNFNMNTDAFFNFVGLTYTSKKQSQNGNTWQVGGFVPIANVNVNVGVGSERGAHGLSDSSTTIADSMIFGSLYWNKGDFYYKVMQSIFVPTGAYDRYNLANAGRNYWGFDTTFAMTHLDHKSGVEVSFAPGIMINTMNPATEYLSGSELHVELALNKHYFKQHYAIGLHAYYYRQITGDSGSGAMLGSFNGEALGIGPAFLWSPPAGKGRVNIIAKYLFDVSHQNRMNGNYGQFMIGYTF